MRRSERGVAAVRRAVPCAAPTSPSPAPEAADSATGGGGLAEFGRLWSLTTGEGWLFWCGLVALFVTSALRAATPVAASQAIAAVQQGATAGTGLVVDAAIRRRISFIFALGLGTALFTGLRALCMGIVTARLLRRLRMMVYTSVLEKDLGWHDGHEVGELTSRVNADCASVSESLTIHLNAFLRSSVMAVFGAVYLMRTSRVLAASLLAVWAGLALITRRYGRFTRRVAIAKQDGTAALSQAVNEDFGLIRVVRSLGLEGRQRERFEARSNTILALDMQRFVAYAAFVGGAWGISSVMSTMTLAVGTVMVAKGSIGVDQLIASLLYVREVIDSTSEAIDQFTSLQQTTGKAKHIFDMIDWDKEDGRVKPPPMTCSGTRTIAASDLKGHIQFNNVIFTYPGRLAHALNGLDLDIAPGKTTALVGASGSGKSTVLALVQRFYDVDGDPESLTLDGVPMCDLDREWLRQKLAVVTQDPRLFADTVFNNIALGAHGLELGDQDLAKAVRDAAEAANAHAFIEELPQGYQTKVGDMKLLSGGQRQRIAIARALLRRPKILILDEATSALDARSEAAVQAAIDNILSSRDITCIVVAHRLATVRNADVIKVMEQGRVIESGGFADLLRRGGSFARLAAEQGFLLPTKGDSKATEPC